MFWVDQRQRHQDHMERIPQHRQSCTSQLDNPGTARTRPPRHRLRMFPLRRQCNQSSIGLLPSPARTPSMPCCPRRQQTRRMHMRRTRRRQCLPCPDRTDRIPSGRRSCEFHPRIRNTPPIRARCTLLPGNHCTAARRRSLFRTARRRRPHTRCAPRWPPCRERTYGTRPRRSSPRQIP